MPEKGRYMSAFLANIHSTLLSVFGSYHGAAMYIAIGASLLRPLKSVLIL